MDESVDAHVGLQRTGAYVTVDGTGYCDISLSLSLSMYPFFVLDFAMVICIQDCSCRPSEEPWARCAVDGGPCELPLRKRAEVLHHR